MAENLRWQILVLLRLRHDCGGELSTADEIAQAVGLPLILVRRACNALVESGAIKPSEILGQTKSGYVITEHGLAMLRKLHQGLA
ncbi:MAG: hypothetical protein HY261_02060 [Chloroflexi bacterium]|nr:hypothetical protein [Chloroflexota bacterium]